MKKVVKSLFVLLTAVTLVCGCGKKEETKEVAYEYIRLQENASTGYSWEYVIDSDGIFDVESNEYTQPETKENLVGVPGYRTFRLVGVKEGSTSITFNYVSPGSKKKVSKTATYEVTVDKDLNVLVVETF